MGWIKMTSKEYLDALDVTLVRESRDLIDLLRKLDFNPPPPPSSPLSNDKLTSKVQKKSAPTACEAVLP
jgi:hypothetical protein